MPETNQPLITPLPPAENKNNQAGGPEAANAAPPAAFATVAPVKANGAAAEPLATPKTPAAETNAGAPTAPIAEKPVAPVKAADIYAMPKEFQSHNRVAGHNPRLVGIVIMVASFLFLALAGAGFYMYIFNPGFLNKLSNQVLNVEETAPVVAPLVEETATSTIEPVAAPTQTPRQVYTNYLNELKTISAFGDYYLVVSKYGDRNRIAAAEAEKLLAESTAEANQASVAALKEKTPQFDGQEIITENIEGERAILTIALSDQKSTGTVEMVLENNVWKVAEENWTLAQAPVASEENYILGEDRDADGLTDAEEEVLGTNKENTDSDSDGYSDLQELSNLYNPAGKDKLVDSPKIKSYLAADGSFSLLYPSQWVRAASSQDGSVMFRSPGDDHFVQLMIFPNERGETLDSYYRRLLGAEIISDSWRRSAATWEGLMTDSGLFIYLMDKNNSQVYVLQYSPGGGATLQYPNIFKAMIKSLVIKK